MTSKDDPTIGPSPGVALGRYLLAQDEVPLRVAATLGSHRTLRKGATLDVLGTETIDGIHWLRVDYRGNEAFIPVDVRLEKAVVERFMVEGVAFIVLSALVIGPFADRLIGSTSNASPLQGITWVLMSLTIVYFGSKLLFGVGGFFEVVPDGETPPRFDWRKFALEPLRFLVVLVVFALGIGLIALARSLFR